MKYGTTGAFVAGLFVSFLSVTTDGGQEARTLNPFAGDPQAIEEGGKLYSSNGCSGCHGAGGGGGMAVALLDDTWVFGSDDETLYKLMKGQIPRQTMPKTWANLPDEQIWKMLAYVRSLYKGDPARIDWSTTPAGEAKPSSRDPQGRR
jgi:mono/diheme cytochrome c family protein